MAATGALQANDVIDGGVGIDTLHLAGGVTVTFGASTLLNVETIQMSAGANYTITTNDATVASGGSITVDGWTLVGTDRLVFDASAETNGGVNVYGGAGNDTITGGAGNDFFDVSGGGNDTVSGGSGGDAFSANAGLTAVDIFDGGAGNDTLTLSGGTMITMGASTLLNVETILLSAGASYDLTTNNATVASGAFLMVNGSTLGTGDTLVFDGSAETNGDLKLTGGAAVDTFFTGLGNDTVMAGSGGDLIRAKNTLSAGDSFDGGAGYDMIFLSGGTTVTMGASTLINTENLILQNGGSYSITMNDAAILAAQSYDVDSSGVSASYQVFFDASAETNGTVYFIGGAANETVIGGTGADTFSTGAGDDILIGGGGTDQITSGSGADMYRYNALTHAFFVASNQTAASAGAFADFLLDFSSGTDQFFFSSGAFTGISSGTLTSGANFVNIGATAFDGTNATGASAWASGGAAFIFDTATNNLYYDSNGSAAGYYLIGNIQTGGTVVAADITVAAAPPATTTGTAGDDVLNLSTGTNVVLAGSGNDLVQFSSGGFDPTDIVDGGAGTDTLALFGGGSGTLGPSSLLNLETIMLSTGSFTLVTHDGNIASGQFLTVDAGWLTSNDTVVFDASAEANGGIIFQGGYNATVTGGAGADTFYMTNGLDRFIGGGGSDYFVFISGPLGSDPNTYLDGGTGQDTLRTQGGLALTATNLQNIETIVLGPGIDTSMTFLDANIASGQSLTLDASTVDAGSLVSANASAENDGWITFIGGAGNDTFTGGYLNDTFMGSGLNDTINGGNGIDLIDYTAATAGITASLASGTVTDGFGGTDTLSNVENIIGTSFNDVITGSTINNSISGGGGNDTLIGGYGNDTMTGGAGIDQFRYNLTGDGTAVASNQTAASAGAVADSITDFTSGTDLLYFSAGGFAGLSVGTLTSGATFINLGATAFDGTNATGATSWSAGGAAFIFDTATNNLYYDSNGATAGYTLVATIQSGGTVTAADVNIF